MTGFGKNTISKGNFTLETEIKSLNSRFLDLSLKLPKELYEYEFAIRDLIKNEIKRGKILLNISLTNTQQTESNISFNKEEFMQTMEILKQIKKHGKFKNDITIADVLYLRDGFLNQKKEDTKIDFNTVKTTIKRAIKDLNKMRLSEGKELEKDLTERINKISKTVKSIEQSAKKYTEEYFEKFKTKAQKLVENINTDKERFIQELAILTEKHDVTEECVRLKSHIKLFKQTAKSSDDTGRKLNFICQEMNREANTINSKSVSTEISHKGLSIKEELEKIREQVQNIE